jgi:signal peptidase II
MSPAIAMTIRVKEIAIVALVVVADQVTKALVLASLPVHESTTVIPGLVDLTHVRNTGAAFGLLNAADFPYKGPIIALVAALALVGVGVYAAGLPAHQWAARLGLTLVLGGAVGNLIDRLRQGYVVDFVDVYWRDHHFWAFNVADSAITIGVAIMILDLMGLGRRVSTPV